MDGWREGGREGGREGEEDDDQEGGRERGRAPHPLAFQLVSLVLVSLVATKGFSLCRS